MIAAATERIRFGPLVTPLARRRPVKVARETAALDVLSGGRLTLGVRLGGDEFASEYSITGEELDDRRRARMLDEALEILEAAWSGEPVRHRGEHYTVDTMRFLPRPVQRPRVPVWVAGSASRAKPTRRAARYDGFFPMRLQSADQLAEIVARVGALREEVGRNPDEPYEVIAELEPGVNPAPYREAGATRLLVAPDWKGISVGGLRGWIRKGPAMGEPEERGDMAMTGQLGTRGLLAPGGRDRRKLPYREGPRHPLGAQRCREALTDSAHQVKDHNRRGPRHQETTT